MDRLMKCSACGLSMIRDFESFRANPYLCAGGIPTIGYGSTRYADGRKVALSDAEISREAAEELLCSSIESCESLIHRVVRVSLTQGQFDALASFTYNVGGSKFYKSTLLMKLNRGDFDGASKEFGRWTIANGKRLTGLVRRRAAERDTFIHG